MKFNFSAFTERQSLSMGWGTLKRGLLNFRVDFNAEIGNLIVDEHLPVCVKRLSNITEYGTTHVVELTNIEDCLIAKAEQPAISLARREGDDWMVVIPAQAIQAHGYKNRHKDRQANPYSVKFTLAVKGSQGWLVPTPQVWNQELRDWQNGLQERSESVEDYGLTVSLTDRDTDYILEDFFDNM